jgi:hypothetical protein
LTVLNPNNADSTLKLTSFLFTIKNPPYVGNANFNLTVFDSTKNYLKQKGNFIVASSTTNNIDPQDISYTISNLFYNESATLTITTNLTIPNPLKLVISIPNDFKYVSGKCIKGCSAFFGDPATNVI